jgi:hypothetical protein
LSRLSEATTRLGIDAKTLRRWLAEAQLPLHSHPHDGQKYGLSDEQLQGLARLHQRSLAPLPQQSPVAKVGEGRALPASLLELPEQLSALQAQLAALQQQMAALTLLLQQPTYPPVSPARPSRTRGRSSTPAPLAPRSHPSAKTPRKPRPFIPRVEYGQGGRYVVTCPRQGVLPFEPDTPEWFVWVAEQDSFRFVGSAGHFAAVHEWRVPKGAWRAHRHIRNHVYVLRLAPNHELTIAVLEQVAQALQAHLSA